MKKNDILILIGLLLGWAFLASCSEEFQKLGPDPSEEFFKLYGGAYDQSGTDLLELDDGFLLLGTTFTATDGRKGQIYLVETDAEGNQVASGILTTLGEGGVGNSIAPASDGGYFICGTANFAQPGAISAPWVIRVDDNYEEDWNEVYEQEKGDGSPATGSARALIEAGGYLYVLGTTSNVDKLKGNANTTVFDSSDVYLMKLDTRDGSLIWEKRYGYTGTDQGMDILDLGNGQLAILGTTDYPLNGTGQSGTFDKDILMIILNEEGNPINTRTFGLFSHNEIASKLSLTDEGFVITGSTSESANASDVLFLTVDFQLNPITGPLSIQNTSFTWGYDIQPIPDGSGDFLVSGTGDTDDNARQDILILRLDSEGKDLKGPKFIGNQRNDAGRSLLIQDGNLVLIGTTQYLSNTMMTLVKFSLDSDL